MNGWGGESDCEISPPPLTLAIDGRAESETRLDCAWEGTGRVESDRDASITAPASGESITEGEKGSGRVVGRRVGKHTAQGRGQTHGRTGPPIDCRRRRTMVLGYQPTTPCLSDACVSQGKIGGKHSRDYVDEWITGPRRRRPEELAGEGVGGWA